MLNTVGALVNKCAKKCENLPEDILHYNPSHQTCFEYVVFLLCFQKKIQSNNTKGVSILSVSVGQRQDG